MERRFINQKNSMIILEKREDGSDGKITGYGAVYYRKGDSSTEYKLWDGMVERIMPGAFNRALAESDDVRALFNHDPSLILGRNTAGTMKLSSDDVGLRYEIDPADTNVSKDTREHISRGDVTGSSFMFIVEHEEWRTEGDLEIREVLGVKLLDIGPVTFPAYASATASVRSEDTKEAREQYKAIVESRNKEALKLGNGDRLRRARLVELDLA